ncbi:MAG: hypothetical protein N2C12_15705 [Planctomycetales bacterium]
MGKAIELAWRSGCHRNSWRGMFDTKLWWSALENARIDAELAIHQAYKLSDRLPWDHVNVKWGRTFLEKEQYRSVVQLATMAEAK